MAVWHRQKWWGALLSRSLGSRFEASVVVTSLRTASQSSAAERQHPSHHDSEPKSSSSIPRKKGLPFIGNFFDFMRAEPNSSHKIFAERAEKLGPIFLESIPGFTGVVISDPQHIRQVLAAEGKYPSRVSIIPWLEYRKDRNLSMATLLSEGEEWQKNRSAVNQHMMRPHNVATHTGDFNAVISDFMPILTDLINKHDGIIPDLDKRLSCWSLETICTVLFDERLGCLESPPSERVAEFMAGVADIFKTTQRMLVIPPLLAKILGLTVWKEHKKAFDSVVEIGKYYTQKKIDEAREKLARGEEVSGLIATLVKGGNLTENEILMNCIDLMGAAIETTAYTTLFVLYMLSRNPDKQQLLYEEIQRVLPSGGIVGQSQLREMRYMKAVLRETMRLFPVAPFTSRILPEEAVIGGYKLEKGTLVTIQLWKMSRDPKLYPDPESFQPERWLRENMEKEPIHPFASLPFGHGVRACIGRRVAELEVFLLVSRILQSYELSNVGPDREVDTENNLLLFPKGDIGLKFQKRS